MVADTPLFYIIVSGDGGGGDGGGGGDDNLSVKSTTAYALPVASLGRNEGIYKTI